MPDSIAFEPPDAAGPDAPPRRIAVVTPVLDDWACLAVLAGRVRSALAAAGWQATIVAIDDGSSEPGAPDADAGADVVVRLTRNVGHQRAIAIGLDYALRETGADTLAIMDSDGEDRPEDLPRLLAALDGRRGRVAAAGRRRRHEGPRFAAFYAVYKLVFRLLTGERLDFGNFCVMGRDAAERLAAMHELWLNLPATVMRSRLDLVRVPTDRGRRYAGRSRMNLVSLVTHGLSAVGVFSDRAFTRTLIAVGGLVAAMAAILAVSLALKAAGLATPGWVTTIAAALAVALIQTAVVSLCGLFVIFGNAANVALSPSAAAPGLIASVARDARPELAEARADGAF